MGTATVLLDLFFEYSLNNFLHAQVESCVHSIVFWKEKTDLDLTQENVTPPPPDPNNSSLQTPKITETESVDTESTKHPLEEKVMDNPALVHLLTNARLLDRLISTWTNTNLPATVSYMGHVTRISNDLVMACASDTVPLCQSSQQCNCEQSKIEQFYTTYEQFFVNMVNMARVTLLLS